MNASKRILAAMKANELQVLAAIRRSAKAGRRWQTSVTTPLTWYRAMDRLVERGKIKYVRSKLQYGFNSGYVITKE